MAGQNHYATQEAGPTTNLHAARKLLDVRPDGLLVENLAGDSRQRRQSRRGRQPVPGSGHTTGRVRLNRQTSLVGRPGSSQNQRVGGRTRGSRALSRGRTGSLVDPRHQNQPNLVGGGGTGDGGSHFGRHSQRDEPLVPGSDDPRPSVTTTSTTSLAASRGVEYSPGPRAKPTTPSPTSNKLRETKCARVRIVPGCCLGPKTGDRVVGRHIHHPQIEQKSALCAPSHRKHRGNARGYGPKDTLGGH